MKETQIPRKNFARSSDSGSKRIKDSETTKNQKVTEKRQSASFSDISVESRKDPVDFTPISDSESESIVIQGSRLDLLSSPEICLLTDESPVSAITTKEASDRVKSISELPDSVQSLREEIRELKNLIYSVDSAEESNRIHGNVTMKLRVVLSSFILWAILAVIVIFFFRSGDEVTYYGPLPT